MVGRIGEVVKPRPMVVERFVRAATFWWMVESCQKCARRNVVMFTVEPEEAWRTVVLNRWQRICPSCFDQEAEKASIRYSFANLEAQSDRQPPRNPYKRKR